MITANAQTVSQGPAPSYERHFAPHLASFGDRDELQDARAPIHDSLVFKWTWPAWFPFGLAFLWWVLELLPMKQWTQDQDRKVSLPSFKLEVSDVTNAVAWQLSVSYEFLRS